MHACIFYGGCDTCTCKIWSSYVHTSAHEQKTYTQANISVLCTAAICVQLRHLMVIYEMQSGMVVIINRSE